MATDLEELDLISAVWILASNDEFHLITYEGIRERLGLSKDFDVKALVLKRRELFRPSALPSELALWQAAMREGRRLPTWIKMIDDASKRREAIDKLSVQDVFRSQFRAESAAPKSQVEIVTWGLEHIDRLRQSRLASKEANAKGWQMWLVFAVGAVNIIATIYVGSMKATGSTHSITAPVISSTVPPK